MQAVIDRILPQDDRDAAHKIPILNVDRRAALSTSASTATAIEDMPPDGEAHRLGLQAIEAIARDAHGKPFVELPPDRQDRVLQTIHDASPPAAQEIWRR